MKLFKLIFEIRYPSSKPEIYRYREKIISAISKSKDDEIKLPNISEGFEFVIKQKNAKVVIENKRMGVDLILVGNYPNQSQYARDNILKIVKLINSQLQVSHIERIGVRSLWLHEVDTAFEVLVAKYKEHFYQTNAIIDASKDVALSLTLYDTDNRINYQSGPLSVEEYKNVLKMNLQGQTMGVSTEVSKPAVLVDYDYFSTKKQTYNDKFAISFVDKALEKTEETVNKTIEILSL